MNKDNPEVWADFILTYNTPVQPMKDCVQLLKEDSVFWEMMDLFLENNECPGKVRYLHIMLVMEWYLYFTKIQKCLCIQTLRFTSTYLTFGQHLVLLPSFLIIFLSLYMILTRLNGFAPICTHLELFWEEISSCWHFVECLYCFPNNWEKPGTNCKKYTAI